VSRAPVLAVFLGLLLGLRPLAAQEPSTVAGLREAALQVAAGWSRDGLPSIGSLMVDRGIRFNAGSGGRETLEPRKAAAALEDLLERRRTRSARVARVTTAEGSEDRGSAEIQWDAVAPGTSQVVRSTVFVGFVREGGRWRIDEIRILP